MAITKIVFQGAGKTNDMENLQKVHVEFGTSLAKIAGYSDVRQCRKLLDNLSDRMALSPAHSVSDLYELILDSIHAMQVKV